MEGVLLNKVVERGDSVVVGGSNILTMVGLLCELNIKRGDVVVLVSCELALFADEFVK